MSCALEHELRAPLPLTENETAETRVPRGVVYGFIQYLDNARIRIYRYSVPARSERRLRLQETEISDLRPGILLLYMSFVYVNRIIRDLRRYIHMMYAQQATTYKI